MEKEFISIQDAADLSLKSIQTIRRAIKAKKMRIKRQKTPQGFNYMIERNSFCEFYGIKNEAPASAKTDAPSNEISGVTNKKVKSFIKFAETEESEDKVYISANDFKNFSQTMERLLNQHSDERQNFLRLITSFQERIVVLENQLNLLSAPKKKWFQLWK
ncbi:hypothetical protein M0P48_04870 [Candidatus Gracilibacteria bacterium]|jgi:site-specific DNA-cytosine methylase|nr:hypothetical protein [Candidatus Gracilibacteria bacterium]